MAEIGVRELKAKASEIVRHVWRKRERYTITFRGRPVGQLIPLGQTESDPIEIGPDISAEAWQELSRLGIEIDRKRRKGLQSADVLSAMRR